MFKFMSVVVPLLPTFALVLYNSIQLESLYHKSNMLDANYHQLQNAISISILVSNLQDERYNMGFRTLSNIKEQPVNLEELADLDDDFGRTDTSIR